MKRKISRIFTPGTVIEDRFLEPNQYNYILSVYPKTDYIGLAWMDISVGEFVMQKTTLDRLKDDLARIRPQEIVLPASLKPDEHAIEQGLTDPTAVDPVTRLLISDTSLVLSYQNDDNYSTNDAGQVLNLLKGNLSTNFTQAELAAGMALIMYVNETCINTKLKWQAPTQFRMHDSVCIDSAAVASLELVKNLQGRRTDSLLSVIDCTTTCAGSRLLSRWITSPLTSQEDINRRLDTVDYFKKDRFLLEDIRTLLRQSTDAQRALQRLTLGRGQYTDLVEVGATLSSIKSIVDRLEPLDAETLHHLLKNLNPHHDIATHLGSAFDYEHIQSKGDKEYGFVNRTYDPNLEKLYKKLTDVESNRSRLQEAFASICGNSVQLITDGPWKHIVEVNTSQSAKLLGQYPEAILVNKIKSKRRFQIEEWTQISLKISHLESQIKQMEDEIFERIVQEVLENSMTILQSCRTLAQLDVLTSFSQLASQNNYVRPRMTRTNRTLIKGGRHPVVETTLSRKGRIFTENDCSVGGDSRIWLLTGPNMGGKSTFLRQNAIIVLMAHLGSFVPADRAHIGITDKIFSRVGAGDNLAQNQSTFMVEMSEVATIIKGATSKSTVIMDEVGRGTSTQDGFALAYSILDHLHNQIKCRTLFATHYHELADEMADYSHIKNYHTSIKETKEGFRFVHKVEPGVCRQSHGIKVAQLAGIPLSIIKKAESIVNSNTSK
jgi:DNA mismatch repair protein MutS